MSEGEVNTERICSVILLFALCGCAVSNSRESDRVRLECALSSEYLDIDWKDLNVDYDGRMFDVVTVTFAGTEIRLLGFWPTVEEVHYLTNGGCNRLDICSLYCGASRNNLHLVVENGRAWFISTVDSTRPIQLASDLEVDELRKLYYQVHEHFVEVDPKKIYVNGYFRKDIADRKGIVLGNDYVSIDKIYEVWDIRNELEALWQKHLLELDETDREFFLRHNWVR
jgi:hypothetical protein